MSTQFFGRQFQQFSQNFDETSKCLQIPLPKPRIEIGSTKSTDNLFAQY